jgi:hypothetical protein
LTVGRRQVGEAHAAGSSHDGPTGTVLGRKELAMAGSDQGPDDVEGHRLRQDTEAADEAPAATDVEGHALRSQDQDHEAATDDVEGHRLRQDTEAIDEDDAEGQRSM